ncbi:hypothetical protein P8452_75786 [Trifolium repens]|nr:hypothetical protein P8452_75786 [Trifolium repens]
MKSKLTPLCLSPPPWNIGDYFRAIATAARTTAAAASNIETTQRAAILRQLYCPISSLRSDGVVLDYLAVEIAEDLDGIQRQLILPKLNL